ncbi:MAG: ATP synthase F1 subunit gamma [Deltaproteobacteria bacterium]
MPSLRDIRKRIGSVKNTRQITKAMKMVAAAKLRRAQEAIVQARPYAQHMDGVLSSLASRTLGSSVEDAPHPLLAVRPPRQVELVLITSDRGLCGGFNANVLRRAQRFIAEGKGLDGQPYERIEVSTLGRKGRAFARRQKLAVRKDYVGIFEELEYDKAWGIAQELSAHYVEAKLDAVFLLYNEFRSAISQQVSLVQLLPIVADAPPSGGAKPIDYLYEPSRQGLLDALLPQHLAMQLWRAMLESQASEHGARMSAMDSATKNASEMISSLTLQYNRARQASITKELVEIVSGAEALK